MSIKLGILLSVVCASIIFLFSASKTVAVESASEMIEGVVTQIIAESNDIQKLKIEIIKGSGSGSEIIIDSDTINLAAGPKYKLGDRLLLSLRKDEAGSPSYTVVDYVRRSQLYILFAVFILITLAVGGLRSLRSVVGMGISFLVMFLYILPAILRGSEPIQVTIIGSMCIIPLTFFLSHGLNKKTVIAIISTLIVLILSGVLATVAVNLTNLSGFASEEAGFLQSIFPGVINMKGLLLSGILISLLGILDDVTVSQVGIVIQLNDVAAHLSFWELYKRAMTVGKDHIASTVNTLILVYAGASLPLLLLFVSNPRPFTEIINYEMIADEIVRTLVGSIGLIAAVPITTLVACLVIHQTTVRVKNSHETGRQKLHQ